MLSGARLRILAHLANFQTNAEDKWNIPREQSLPGIAEALGVVRSALHTPLTSLEQDLFVLSRNAQVTGIGSRRRTVIHITEKGLLALSESNTPINPRKRRNFGPVPNLTDLHGRNSEIENIANLLNHGSNVLLNGLPGIGKTSLARGVSDILTAKGWTLRWASCNIDSDISSIANMWLQQSGLSSPDSITAAVDSSRTLLVLDEIQELHKRHISAVEELLVTLSSVQTPVLAIVRAPSPFENLADYENIRLDGLKSEYAKKILPKELDNDISSRIVESLGGHPLALHLWTPDEELPEKIEAVQEYVKSTVIKRLSNEGIETLDELCLAPTPLDSDELFYSVGADELDESAILRWLGNQLEPHHLIRNVRRSHFSQDDSQTMHMKMAQKWATRSGPRARRIESHHRLKSGEIIDSEWLVSNILEIMKEDSAAAAIIIDQAIENNEEEVFREVAADIALERGETEIANSHIELLSDGTNKILRLARLARIRGNSKLAEKLDYEASQKLSTIDKIKNEISTLVRLYDDRLPGPIKSDLVSKLKQRIDDVDISSLPDNERNAATLSLNLLKHSIALETQDLTSAAYSRSLLESQLGYDNPRLRILDLRASLLVKIDNITPPEAILSARNEINKCGNLLDKIILIHATLEASTPKHPNWLVKIHSEVSQERLREDIAAYRRISAQRWYWRGVLEPERKLSHWREAISRFRNAECSNAVNDLLTRISNMI